MVRRFVPDMGDVVWLEFSPQAGHEQAGHRPALVLSPAAYNNKTGMMVCCPLTTQIKGYPFEVIIHAKDVSGAVLADQIKSLDWGARKAKLMGKVSAEELDEVRGKISALLGLFAR
jgi:mRNA interferase MazF